MKQTANKINGTEQKEITIKFCSNHQRDIARKYKQTMMTTPISFSFLIRSFKKNIVSDALQSNRPTCELLSV